MNATLLGAAGEISGLDRMLKVNPAKNGTHSFFRQGRYDDATPATCVLVQLRCAQQTVI